MEREEKLTALNETHFDLPVKEVVRAVIVEVAGVVVDCSVMVIVAVGGVVIEVEVSTGVEVSTAVSVRTDGRTHPPDSEL